MDDHQKQIEINLWHFFFNNIIPFSWWHSQKQIAQQSHYWLSFPSPATTKNRRHCRNNEQKNAKEQTKKSSLCDVTSLSSAWPHPETRLTHRKTHTLENKKKSKCHCVCCRLISHFIGSSPIIVSFTYLKKNRINKQERKVLVGLTVWVLCHCESGHI